MQYFFILGNHPALSLAELSQQSSLAFVRRLGNAAIFQSDGLVDPSLFQRLGGSVKVGVILEEISVSKLTSEYLTQRIESCRPPRSGKFFLGMSFYGLPSSDRIKWPKKIFSWGLAFKKYLKEHGGSMRLVTSREPQLSSVIVEKNRLTTAQGLELVFVFDDQQVFIGRTLWVQEFSQWSGRDYGRPARDARSGMLPPKLARMMIHLSGADTNAIFGDPFCGSGTVLQEALLLGFRRVFGSDSSDQAIRDSQENLMWLKNRHNLDFTFTSFENIFSSSADSGSVLSLRLMDVRQIAANVPVASVRAIVTEPYLGSPHGRRRTARTVFAEQETLQDLYTQALTQFSNILCPSGRVVMIWPFFRLGNIDYYLDLKKITAELPFKVVHWSSFVATNQRGALQYVRSDQHVGREIWVFEKAR